MSIYGALYTGITGLAAQSTAIGAISDNIANVNTVGYKSTTTHFSTLVTRSATRNDYNPGGVRAVPLSNIDFQGQLQATATKTDLATVGKGFFIVSNGPQSSDERLFTRAGSFRPDAEGYLVNTAGYYLQGYPLATGASAPTSSSTFAGLEGVNINGVGVTVEPTSNVELALNLPASGSAAVATTSIQQALNLSSTASANDTYDVTTDVYDDEGGIHTITTTYTKAASPDEWTVTMTAPDATVTNNGPYTVTFDSSTGLLKTVPSISAQFQWNSGASSSTIALDIGAASSTTGAAQIGSGYSTSLSTQIDGTLPTEEVATVQVYDNLGNVHNIDLTFRKTDVNQWAIDVADPTKDGVKSGTVAAAARTITFNSGLPNSISIPPLAIAWDPGIGASDSTITLDVGTTGGTGGLTQFAGDFLIKRIEQDGVPLGNYRGISISETGLVRALLDNGQTLDIYQLAMGVFPNPNGLEARPGNAYSGTEISGNFLLNIPGVGGTGEINSSSLEISNVDLASEFTNMIITQRAYSASSKVITTADEMLDELIRTVR